MDLFYFESVIETSSVISSIRLVNTCNAELSIKNMYIQIMIYLY